MGHFTADIEPDGEIYNEQFISLLTDAGFSQPEAHVVLTEAYTMGTTPVEAKNFERHFKDNDGNVDVAKVAAMGRIQNTRMTADSYDPILQDRADNTDNDTQYNELKEVVELMDALGYEAGMIAKTIERYVKIAKAATPHPTEHLSPDGIDKSRALASAGEETALKRPAAIKQALANIVESDDFAGSKKADIVDEADNSNHVARIHNNGANEYDRAIEQMIEEVTGQSVDVNTNTGQKSWDFDADGKPNADGFAMMMKMTTTTYGSMSDTSERIKVALDGDMTETMRAELTALKANVDQVIENLLPVYRESRDITRDLAAEGDSAKREAMYRDVYENRFKPLFNQLESIYDSVDEETRGMNFYKQALETLDKARKSENFVQNNPVGTEELDDAFRDLKRNGFVLEKGQTRHNDLVYKSMLDNMFASPEFMALPILDEEDKALIAREGSFSKMKHEDEYAIMQKVLEHATENGNRKDITGILERSNPLSFVGSGYPAQNSSYTDRMKLRALFPYKFDEGVISDAGAYGSPRQKFIADLYGIENMKHMSLNEDKMNLARQGSLPRTFNEFGGADNLQARTDKRDDIEKRLTKALHIMRPASDAERAGGSFTRLQAIEQYREIVREAYDMKVPIEVMIGGGQSLNRFGGDVDMVRRILAQELKDVFMEKKATGQGLEDYDQDMMMMATSVLYTEQGRTKRMVSATPGQVRDGLMKKTTNMLKDLLDLKGDVQDYTFIDKRTHFSPNMDRVQKAAWRHGIEDYAALNQAYTTDEKGEVSDDLLLDKFTNTAAPMHMVPFQNYGSRPAAGKASDDKKAQVSGFRAIGKDQTLYSMQSFHAGFYAAGGAMGRIHSALNTGDFDKRITLDDIDDLMNDADWDEAIFSRDLIDSARFNATQISEKIFGEEESQNWDYDRMMALGQLVQVHNARGEDEKFKLAYTGPEENVSQEQMYFAKIYYDRARFLAMTEAALAPKGAGITMKNTQAEILNAFKPKDGLEITLGARTQEKWPSVMDQVMEDHKKNAPAYALNNMIDDDIQRRKDAEQTQEDINTYYGQGEPSKAEKFFRGVSSALRSGTLPHKDKWTGKEGIGLVQRQKPGLMQNVINYIKSRPENMKNSLEAS